MDEMENKAPEESPKVTETAKDAAMDAAKDLKAEAEKTLGEIKGRGIGGFFSFDQMYFPIIARYIFIILVVLSVIGMVVGVLTGFISLFSTGIIAGIGMILGSIIGGLLGIVFTRIWFELIILGFKIYEGIQEIRVNSRK